MSKNRGLHNYMQRRAQARSPGPSPRVRAGGRASMPVPMRVPLRPTTPGYQHRHMRSARDLPTFVVLAERLERLPRGLERLRRAWERRLGHDPLRGRYGPSPERRVARRDVFGSITTTTVSNQLPTSTIVRISIDNTDTSTTDSTTSTGFAVGW